MIVPDVLLNELNREPFVPLRLHFSSGATLDIANPALAWVEDLALRVSRIDRVALDLPDDCDVFSLQHIERIEMVGPPRTEPLPPMRG